MDVKMTEVKKIKKAFYEDKLSKSQICREFHRSWETVDKIIKTPLEFFENSSGRRSVSNRRPTVGTQAVQDKIKEMLLNEQAHRIKKKQRLTAKVIYAQLIEKSIYHGSYKRIQELVRKVKENLNQLEIKSYLPLHFALGSALQIDHGEVECCYRGEVMICYLFVASVPGVPIRFYQLFPKKSQEMWGEFHERVFNIFEGVFPKIIYDNDTVLICSAGEKKQTGFCLYLQEHYKFAPHYCSPASGNEKGSVENAVGYGRRNYLNGRPIFNDFRLINFQLRERFFKELSGIDPATKAPLNSIFEDIAEKLMPTLPSKEWARKETRIVNSYQMVEVEKHLYSIPEKYVGKQITVHISHFYIKVYYNAELIATHVRQFASGEDSLYWDHYLEQLEKKPGALWDCRVTQGLLEDPVLEQAWQLASQADSLRDAKKDFIQILFLRREYDEQAWKSAILASLAIGRMKSEEVRAFLQLKEEGEGWNQFQEIEDKIPHVVMPKVDYDLSQYGQLCEVQDAE